MPQARATRARRGLCGLAILLSVGTANGSTPLAAISSLAELSAALLEGGTWDITRDIAFDSELDITNVTNVTLMSSTGAKLRAADRMRVFNVNTNAALTLSNLTLIEGGNPKEKLGAAVYVGVGATLTTLDCSFLSNAAPGYGRGGAVYVDVDAAFTALACTFVQNEASRGRGGAVYVAADAAFIASECTFDRNKAGFGGAVYVEVGAAFTASTCAFSHNKGRRSTDDVYVEDGGAFTADECEMSSAMPLQTTASAAMLVAWSSLMLIRWSRACSTD